MKYVLFLVVSLFVVCCASKENHAVQMEGVIASVSHCNALHCDGLVDMGDDWDYGYVPVESRVGDKVVRTCESKESFALCDQMWKQKK